LSNRSQTSLYIKAQQFAIETMSILKVALIAGIVVAAIIIGVAYMSSLSNHVSGVDQQADPATNETGGKHFDLELSESVNVKGTP
jgi:hypothetical protein